LVSISCIFSFTAIGSYEKKLPKNKRLKMVTVTSLKGSKSEGKNCERLALKLDVL